MADITNVNLLYQRKARGLAPLSRFACQDDGSLLVSVPDEMEVRTFHIAKFSDKGRSQVVETYNVETLRKTEIADTGTNFVGFSEDNVYVFQGPRKTRLLPDRRPSYADIALTPNGQKFVAGFSDLLASGHTLALGDNTGRLLWTRDVTFVIKRVAINRSGEALAVAGETGEVHVLNTARNPLVRYQQEAPINALATTGQERTVFAGGGGVGAIDADGKLIWFTEIDGEVIEVVLDATANVTAALVRLDDTMGRLVFLSADGLPTWEVDYDDVRPTGISLSGNGRYCGVTLRDGSLCLYELQYGERLTTLNSDQILAEARSAQEGEGSLTIAVELLKSRLSSVPSDSRVCEVLTDLLGQMKTRALAGAQTAEVVEDFAGADARLAEAVSVLPYDADLITARAALRSRWSAHALHIAKEALTVGDGPTAETRLLEAIDADPLNTTARALLADARYTSSSGALERARKEMATGQFPEAISSITEAQSHGASGPEVTNLLRQARVGEALSLGNALYQDRQYASALFQFKKVLRLDPDNADALQKVSYAQNFLQDTQLNDRFTRLE